MKSPWTPPLCTSADASAGSPGRCGLASFFGFDTPSQKMQGEKHGFPRIIHYQWRFWMGFPLFSRDFRNMKKKTRDFVHFVFSWISVNSRNGSEVEISLGRHGNLTDDGDLTIKHLGWTISSWGLARGWSNKIQYDSKTLPKEFTSVNRDIDQHRDYTHWYGSNQVLWVCPLKYPKLAIRGDKSEEYLKRI